jgi:hypothetical protein
MIISIRRGKTIKSKPASYAVLFCSEQVLLLVELVLGNPPSKHKALHDCCFKPEEFSNYCLVTAPVFNKGGPPLEDF